MFRRAERSQSRSAVAVALLIATAITATGCGGGDSEPTTTASGPQRLTPSEARMLERTTDVVARYCARAAQRFRETGLAPPTSQYERVIAALDDLAELAREKPSASTPDGDSPRFALGDIAESLEGNNCDARLVTHIDAELATIPTE